MAKNNEKQNDGYALPENIETDKRKCYCIEIPDEPEYRYAFLNQIMHLMRWFAWEKRKDHSAADAAQVWRNVLSPQIRDEFMCSSCSSYCSQLDVMWINQQAADRLAALDTGSYLSFAPDAPDTSFSEDSHDATADDIAKRINALCLAVSEFLAMELSYWAGLVGLGAAVVTAISLALGPVAPILAISLGSIAGLTYATLSTILSDPEAIRKVVCNMYEGLLGQTISFANFKAACDPSAFPDGNAKTLTLWLQGACQKEENYRAFVSILGRDFAASSPDSSNCDNCCATTVYTYNWKDNTPSNSDDVYAISTSDVSPSLIPYDPAPTTPSYIFNFGAFSGGHYFNGSNINTNGNTAFAWTVPEEVTACNLKRVRIGAADSLYGIAYILIKQLGVWSYAGGLGTYDATYSTKDLTLDEGGVTDIAVVYDTALTTDYGSYVGLFEAEFG